LPRKHPINSDPPAVISYMKFVTGLLAIAVLAFFTGVEAKTKPQSVNVNATIKVSVNGGGGNWCDTAGCNAIDFPCTCGCVEKYPDNKQREKPEHICDPVCDDEHFCACSCARSFEEWCGQYCQKLDHCDCDCPQPNLCNCQCL